MEGVRHKAVCLVLAIVLVFLVQWSPLWFFQFYQMFATHHIENVQLVNMIISTLSYSNTVANPILYMLLTYNFKQYVRKNLFNKFFRLFY